MKIPKFATKAPFRRVFRSCEAHFGTRVPFYSTVTPISQLRNGCEAPKREKSQFCSQSSILKSISKLRNHFLAHECHFEAPHTHFAAAKWLRNLHTLKSFSAHTMSWHVIAAPPFRQLLDTIRSLNEVQIMYAISHFKAWEVRSLELQTMHNLELNRRSYGHLKTSAQSWAKISQPRHHLEGCFVGAKPLFGTWVPFAAQFPSFRSCEMGCEINFGLRNHFWALKWLRNHLQASKGPSSCEIDLRNGGRFAKTPCKAKGSC